MMFVDCNFCLKSMQISRVTYEKKKKKLEATEALPKGALHISGGLLWVFAGICARLNIVLIVLAVEDKNRENCFWVADLLSTAESKYNLNYRGCSFVKTIQIFII